MINVDTTGPKLTILSVLGGSRHPGVCYGEDRQEVH